MHFTSYLLSILIYFSSVNFLQNYYSHKMSQFSYDFRNHAAWASPSDDSSVAMKRYVVFAFLVFLFFVTLIVLLTRVGQTSIAEEHDHGNWVGGESRHEPLPSDHI